MSARERLHEARRKAGVSRRVLAERMGKAQSTISAHENGQNNITAEAAAEYGRVLKVSPSWLLYGDADAETRPRDAAPPEKPTLTITNGRVRIVLDEEVSVGVAAKILALIEGDE